MRRTLLPAIYPALNIGLVLSFGQIGWGGGGKHDRESRVGGGNVDRKQPIRAVALVFP